MLEFPISADTRPIVSLMALVANEQTSATTHGLSNAEGENNCFINSVIQILWHLDIFRIHFGEIQQHICYELECVFCTLKELFVNFQYSESVTLPPNFIRKAMAKCYRESGRFQLSKMDYAVECYEAVLQQIHTQITGTDWDTTCTFSQCLPHKIFSYSSCQIDVCACGATSEPFPSEDILFYISADNLLKVVKKSKKSQKEILKDGKLFGAILRESLSIDKKHACPDSEGSTCKKSARIETMLLRSPYTINLSLSWSSEIPSKEKVVETLKSVGHVINISQMFSVSLDETAEHKAYHLSGMVNYYGHHFSAFVYNTNLNKWVFCDDATFRTVGDDWNDVVQLIKRARYQPELLIYSMRDVDIWIEEKKRKPLPKIPPKPNLAHYIPSMNPSSGSGTDLDSQVNPRPNRENLTAPILPPTLSSNTPVQPSAPPMSGTGSLYPNIKGQSLYNIPTHMTQQPSPIPSAPPAPLLVNNSSLLSHQNVTRPQLPSQAAKPKKKTSLPVPSSTNPVVLVDYALKPDTRHVFYFPRSNYSTPVSTPDLLGFEALTHPDGCDTGSAPNLLLDVSSHKPRSQKVTSNVRPVPMPQTKKRTDTSDLIDFTYIPALRADDVYNEFFPIDLTNAQGKSKSGRSSNSS